MKELIEEKNFEMRAYDKVELALLYFSVYHSADCCTSLSLFLYMLCFFLVLDRGSFSTSLSSF